MDDPKSQYGHSKETELSILDKKFLREPKLTEEYNKVMEEYFSLNHMTTVFENELQNPKAFYLSCNRG